MEGEEACVRRAKEGEEEAKTRYGGGKRKVVVDGKKNVQVRSGNVLRDIKAWGARYVRIAEVNGNY